MLSHPDDLAISSGWFMVNAVCHLDDLRCCPIPCGWHIVIQTQSHPNELDSGRISPGWLMANAVCRPDDLRCYPKSSGWHNESWTLSHPDELAHGRISPGLVMVSDVSSWWRHQMETFFALLALCAGKSPVPGEFPAQRPVTRSFDVFFDLCLESNGWVNNREAGDLRRHRVHYEVIVMSWPYLIRTAYHQRSIVFPSDELWFGSDANTKCAVKYKFYLDI